MKKLLVLALSALLISPVMAQEAKPDNATAVCKDGSYSTAKSVRGACARHGGVDKWLVEPAANDAKPTKPEKADKADKKAVTKEEATAICKDGSYTKARSTRGACARHGGVDQWYIEPAANDAKPEKADQVAATPEEATAICKDGSYTKARSTRGACARHGGVDKWLVEPDAKADKAERKNKEERIETTNDGTASALCKDGTYSYSKTHKGTCSRHGGVDKWLKD